jgi:hypothetical protein
MPIGMSKNEIEPAVLYRTETNSHRKVRRRGGGALLDTPELAAALGESTRTIRTWSSNGIIKPIICGYRSHRFRLDDVLAQLQKRALKGLSK